MKTAAIIQARMGSTRYPGKVLDEIAGIPMLQHIVERARYAQTVDVIVIATTASADDRILLKRAREWQVVGFAGPEHDVLKRYVAAANLVQATHIVRITGDNPLFEPSFVDACVRKLVEQNADYCYVEACILGTGVEAITLDALKREDSLATEAYQREHVNPYVMEHPEQFKVIAVPAEERFRMPEGVRLTVDTKEDIKLVRRIYRRLHQADRIVSLSRTVELLKENPEWVGLNKDVFQKPATSSELEDEEAEAEPDALEDQAEEVDTVDQEPAEKEEVRPAPLPAAPFGLRIPTEKPPEDDKLDVLMAQAVSKEEQESKRKEDSPSLDDVLAKTKAEVTRKPVDTSALDKLFGGAAEEPVEEAIEAAPPDEVDPVDEALPGGEGDEQQTGEPDESREPDVS
ncbi:MAG: glycosyltransferase family protein [Verrucomicrobia bacterium]|nr:glycosyltransferase family protein [Verrucomicrobiota bacterium]